MCRHCLCTVPWGEGHRGTQRFDHACMAVRRRTWLCGWHRIHGVAIVDTVSCMILCKTCVLIIRGLHGPTAVGEEHFGRAAGRASLRQPTFSRYIRRSMIWSGIRLQWSFVRAEVVRWVGGSVPEGRVRSTRVAASRSNRDGGGWSGRGVRARFRTGSPGGSACVSCPWPSLRRASTCAAHVSTLLPHCLPNRFPCRRLPTNAIYWDWP